MCEAGKQEARGLLIEALHIAPVLLLCLHITAANSKRLTSEAHNIHTPDKLILPLCEPPSTSPCFTPSLHHSSRWRREKLCHLAACQNNIISFVTWLNGFFSLEALTPKKYSQDLCIICLTVSVAHGVFCTTLWASFVLLYTTKRSLFVSLFFVLSWPSCLRPFSDTGSLTFSLHKGSHY